MDKIIGKIEMIQWGLESYAISDDKSFICGSLGYNKEKTAELINRANKGKRIIKVKETDIMGYSGNTKYFYSLNKAKKYFKELFNSYKSDISDQCAYQNEPIQWDKRKIDGRNKCVSIEYWTSYETECGTEHDTTIAVITLEELKIE